MGISKGTILKPIKEPKINKVNFNKSGNGYISSGRITISKNKLESIGVTEEKPYINVICKDNKIIIEPKEGV